MEVSVLRFTSRILLVQKARNLVRQNSIPDRFPHPNGRMEILVLLYSFTLFVFFVFTLFVFLLSFRFLYDFYVECFRMIILRFQLKYGRIHFKALQAAMVPSHGGS